LLVGCNAISGVSKLVVDEGSSIPQPDGGDDQSDANAPPPPGDDSGNSENRDANDDFVPFDGADASTTLIVFVTSTTTTGAIGGLANADIMCQARATSAGLPGKFVAWMSAGSITAQSRITAAGPWFLTSGELAATRAQLQAPTNAITHPISVDENKTQSTDDEAWTGTSNNGPSGNDCVSWNVSSPTPTGTVGNIQGSGAGWTNRRNLGCSNDRHLYCFQN
jgi:hypothetical protein